MRLNVKGESMPAIGLGTWTLYGQRCTVAVEKALAMGYRMIDTAQDYANEAEVGRAMARSGVAREEIFLVTKVHPSNFLHEATVRSTHESLRKLGTAYVDLLLMHWPNPQIPLEKTLSAMSQLQAEGKVKHIGVSNFSPSLVEEARRHAAIFCNQIEYHPFLAQDGLIAQSRSMGHLLMAYCPLAKGRVFVDATLEKIAAAYNKTPGQVALRWIVQQGLVPIPKASNEDHQRENLAIFDFTLSEVEMAVISGLDEGLRLDPVSIYTEA